MADLNLKLLIDAEDRATGVLERIARETIKANKFHEEQGRLVANREKREIAESQRREEKHAYWKQGIEERKTRTLEREAEKRQRIAEKEVRDQQRLREKTLSDFRSDAQKMALLTTTPAAIMGVIGARAFMEMEQRQLKMKMFFKQDAKEMEAFAEKYAYDTAFNIDNAATILTLVKEKSDEFGVKNNKQIQDMTKVIGDVVLAYAPSMEAQNTFIEQFRQVIQRGKAGQQELSSFSRAGLNMDDIWTKKMGRKARGTNEEFTRAQIIEIMTFMSKTDEVIQRNIDNAKTLTQAWGSAGEAVKSMQEGLGKTLNEQFNLTGAAKVFGSIMQQIGKELKSNDTNMTKGMTSYLMTLGLTVAPMLMLIGHWGKVKTLIMGSNMQAGLFQKRLFLASAAMSGL